MLIRWTALGVGVLMLATLSAKEYRIGFIDSDAVIAEYEETRAAREELQTEVAKFRSEADSLKRDYDRVLSEYESQKLTLSDEGRKAKMAEVDQLKRRYDAFVDEVYRPGGRVDQKNKELIAPLVEKINGVVGEVAAEQGFSLVLDAAGSEIVYAEDGLDLTEMVIEELNREFVPVGPGEAGDRLFSILTIYGDDKAREDNIDLKIRQFVYSMVKEQPKVEMLANAEGDKQLSTRGYEGRQLTSTEAIDVGVALNADYVLFGSCTQEDRRISFSLTIVDVRLNTEVKTVEGQASSDKTLNEEVGGAVRALLTSVEQP